MKNIFLKLFIIMTFIGCTTNEFELPNEGSGGRATLVFGRVESDGGVEGGNTRDFSIVEANSNVNNREPIRFFDISRLAGGRTWFFPEGAVDILGSSNDTTSTEKEVSVRFRREGVFEIRLVPDFSSEVEAPLNEGVVTFTVGPELRLEVLPVIRQNRNGDIILNFTRSLDPETLEDLSAFELKVDGEIAEIASVRIEQSNTAAVIVEPAVAISNNQTARISYTPQTLISAEVDGDEPFEAQPLAESDVRVFFFDVLFDGRNGAGVDGNTNGNYNFEGQGGVWGFNTVATVVRQRVPGGSTIPLIEGGMVDPANRTSFSFSNLDGGNFVNFSQGDRFNYPGGVKLLLFVDYKVTSGYEGDFRITIGNNNTKKASNIPNNGTFDGEWHRFTQIMQPAGDNGTIEDPELTAGDGVPNAFLEMIGRQSAGSAADQEIIIDNLRIIALDQ